MHICVRVLSMLYIIINHDIDRMRWMRSTDAHSFLSRCFALLGGSGCVGDAKKGADEQPLSLQKEEERVQISYKRNIEIDTTW